MNLYIIIEFEFYEEANFTFFIYVMYTLLIATVLLGISFLCSIVKKANTLSRTEGSEVYEFGATSIGSSSAIATNKHYLILAVLFIIFDVELMILFPYELFSSNAKFYNSSFILVFLLLLMIGYSYELISGALSWHKSPSVELVQRFKFKWFNNSRINILNKRKVQLLYLNFTIITTFYVLNLVANWDAFLYKSQFQFSNTTQLTTTKGPIILQITNDFILPTIQSGYDTFSLLLSLVTSILFTIAILSNWNSELLHSLGLFYFMLSWIEGCLIIAFSSLDLFIFYICFEGIAIPTFFIIYLFGAELTKIRASIVFLISSLLSSGCITIALVSFYTHYKTSGIYQLLTKMFLLNGFIVEDDPQYQLLLLEYNCLSPERTAFLWVLLFIGFAIKLPICPFHMWLPEAHAEAPTAGSVILAGCILKLGSFGLFRFFIPLFAYFNWFTPLIFVGCLGGILYTAYVSLRVNNIKQVIAYSSVAHMGGAVIGLFTGYKAGITASLFSFLQHSITSSGFFYFSGTLIR